MLSEQLFSALDAVQVPLWYLEMFRTEDDTFFHTLVESVTSHSNPMTGLVRPEKAVILPFLYYII